MAKNPVKPQGIGWVSPYLIVQDIDKSFDFYHSAFGFEKGNIVSGEDGTNWYASMNHRSEIIMIGKEYAWGSTTQSPKTTGITCPMNLYLYVENVDTFYQAAVEAGAVSLSAPDDTFWGDRMCSLHDPDQYMWCFATFLGEKNT